MTVSEKPVLAFAGHLLDRPDRPVERFPARLEGAVAAAIGAALDRLDPAEGYVSAACGGDILFIEAMVRRGRATTVVLPFDADSFASASVAFAGQGWTRRFEQALRTAVRVVRVADGPYLGDDVLFSHVSDVLQGMARLRAAALSSDARLLAAIDPAAQGATGGAAETLKRWSGTGGAVEIVDLAAVRAAGRRPAGAGHAAVAATAGPQSALADAPRGGREVVAFLRATIDRPSADALARLSESLGAPGGLSGGIERDADGVSLRFADVVAAASCAQAIVLDASGFTAANRPRCAIHVGSTPPASALAVRGRPWPDRHRGVAARLARLAPAGAVWLSEVAAAVLTASSTRYAFVPVRPARPAVYRLSTR